MIRTSNARLLLETPSDIHNNETHRYSLLPAMPVTTDDDDSKSSNKNNPSRKKRRLLISEASSLANDDVCTSADIGTDILHNSNTATTERKSTIPSTTPDTDNSINTSNINSADTNVTLSPHVLRLLKLIQSAPTSYARDAAHLLGEICSASASTPCVLWEILGRLVIFLSSHEWSTRENAAVAIYSVAQHVPLIDQRAFLSTATISKKCSHKTNSKEFSANHSDNYEWLSVTKLDKSLSDIIQNGRVLYARNADDARYSFVVEEEQINNSNLDASSRMNMQRIILAKRLGLILPGKDSKMLLDEILCTNDKAGNKNNFIENDDSSNTSIRSSMDAAIKRRKRKRELLKSCDCSALQSLLLSSVTINSSQQPNASLMIRQNLAQNILATEIIFNTMSGDWRVRHGAVLGGLHLFKAWCESNINNSNLEVCISNGWGDWAEDVLCRSIALLILDQFNDFSNHTYISDLNNTGKGSQLETIYVTESTAPVREAAAQLMSYLYRLIPVEHNDIRLSIWNILLQIYDSDSIDDGVGEIWYRQHGALIGLKYLILITMEASESFSEMSTSVCKVICSALDSKNDEVITEASVIFICILSSDSNTFLNAIDIEGILTKVIFNLSKVESHSSHAANSLTLLSLMFKKRKAKDCPHLNSIMPTLTKCLRHHNFSIQLTTLSCICHVLNESLSQINYNSALRCVFELKDEKLFVGVSEAWLYFVKAKGMLNDTTVVNLIMTYAKSKLISIRVHLARLLVKLLREFGYFQNILLLLLHSEFIEAGLMLLLIYLENGGIFKGMQVLRSNLNYVELQLFHQLWTKLFDLEYEELLKSIQSSSRQQRNCLPTNLEGIRLENLISCCIVYNSCNSGSFDSKLKLTPIIRPLITSIKNDSCVTRGSFTNRAICKLLDFIPKIEVRHKVVRNLMEFFLAKIGACNHNLSIPAKCLSYLVWNSSEENLEPIFEYLMKLEHGSFVAYEAILNDIDCKETSSFVSFIEKQLPHFLNMSLSPADEEKAILARCLVVKSSKIHLSSVIKQLFQKSSDEKAKKNIVMILTKIIEIHTVEEIIPYVRKLLSFVFTNLAQSAHLFGKLVTLAPLVPHEDVKSDNDTDKLILHLIHGEPLPLVSVPIDVKVQLRHYQRECISWLEFLRCVGVPGGICADEMGLGKTLQCLFGILMSEYKINLIICPSTLVTHWKGEVNKFFEGQLVCEIYDSRFPPHLDDSPSLPLIVIASYSQLRKDLNWFLNIRDGWGYVALDEGHLIGNHKTATARAVHKLRGHSKFRLILSGTPIQNCIEELFTLFEFIMPGYLGLTHSHFWDAFGRDIVKSQRSSANANEIQLGMTKLKRLHQAVLPFILRREKATVLKELPPKIIQTVIARMSDLQLSVYEQILKDDNNSAAIEDLLRQLENQKVEIQNCAEISKNKNTLHSLLRLRLVCTHPLLLCDSYKKYGKVKSFLDKGDDLGRIDASGKVVALYELLREILGVKCRHLGVDDDESAIFLPISADRDCNEIFDETNCNQNDANDTIETIQDLKDPLDLAFGKISNSYLSTKANQIQNRKCVIFAQFTGSLDIVEHFLFKPHMPSLCYLRLDGTIPASQRGNIVNQFTNDASIRILLATTKVGGLGLNLTCADTVIFLEPSWNPHADIQAMDRIHRLGQRASSIHIFRLVIENSIEEQIMRLQKRKLEMSNAIINTENSSMFSMGTEQLLDLFSVSDGEDDKDGDRMHHHERNDDTRHDNYWLEEHKHSSVSVKRFLSGMKPK